MKLNSATKIIGDKIILVPYRSDHVPKYHQWMESVELRQETASERLSLEEEFAMQQSWLNDEYKCTFIVLDKDTMEKTNDEVASMIGDANLYLTKREEENTVEAELGLMIAEQSYRRSGRGRETALFIIRYGIEFLHIRKFIAVTSQSNLKSISLFQKLKFSQEKVNHIFEEIILSKIVDDNWLKFILDATPSFKIEPTHSNF